MKEQLKKLEHDLELYSGLIKSKQIQKESLIRQDLESTMPSDHWQKIERVGLDLDKLISGARTISSKMFKLQKELNILSNPQIN